MTDKPKWTDLFGIDPNYLEGVPEEPKYTESDIRVLTEAALRLGREETRAELDALRALWWFMNNDMGVCDGGAHAVLSWAEVTDMNDLHDAVEAIYQESGYPPKPGSQPADAAPEPSTEASGYSDLPQDSQAVRSPRSCPECGEVHVMGCGECGADLDKRGHYPDCPRSGDPS